MTRKLSCDISALKNKVYFEWIVFRVRVQLWVLFLIVAAKELFGAKKRTSATISKGRGGDERSIKSG